MNTPHKLTKNVLVAIIPTYYDSALVIYYSFDSLRRILNKLKREVTTSNKPRKLALKNSWKLVGLSEKTKLWLL